MRVLITGAGGFIGRRLIHALQSDHQADITALARHPLEMEGVRSCLCDVLDADAVEDAFRERAFDYVVHLAAVTAHSEIVDNRQATFEINLRGTMNLLNSFNRHCRGAQFIYASTGKVYGRTNEMPISESAAVNPTNILGKSKRITEEVIDFCAVPENRYLICRIFNIYGENQKRNFVVPTIIDQLDRDAVQLGALKDLRDYLYVDDLISALTACMSHGDAFAPVDHVNIGSGEPACVADILREMEKLLGRKINVEVKQARLRRDETPVEFCDHGKLTALTGWEPAYTLESGLEKTLRAEGVIS